MVTRLRLVPSVILCAAAGLAAGQATWQDLIRTLRHPDVRARLDAVEALGQAGYTAAAEAVAPLVVDPDDRVQFAAIDAELTFFLIEPVGARRGFGLVGGSRSRAQQAFEAGPLVRAAAPVPPAVIDHLVKAIRDENPRIRFDAIHAVGVIAEPPVPPAQAAAILDGLDHYEPTIRAATARVLGRLHVRTAADKLLEALHDSSSVVRRYAMEALGRLRDERAVAALTNAVAQHAKGEIAAEALLALARIGHPSSQGLLRSKLSDGDPGLRRAAVEGLGVLGDTESIEALKGMAGMDRSPIVRLAALVAIGRLGEPRLPAVVEALGEHDTSALARDYLLEIGAPAGPAVRAALASTPDARRSADLLHLLGYLGARNDVAVLEPFLSDKDEQVSRAAGNAIARLKR